MSSGVVVVIAEWPRRKRKGETVRPASGFLGDFHLKSLFARAKRGEKGAGSEISLPGTYGKEGKMWPKMLSSSLLTPQSSRSSSPGTPRSKRGRRRS